MAKKKKEIIYKNLESLKQINKVLNDVNEALNNPKRTIEESSIKEVLASVTGVGIGSGIGLASLYFGGSVVGLSAAGITSGLASAGAIVGGGMAAGIGVLAAPPVILGITGYAVASKINKKKLITKKTIVYKDAIAKQTAIINAMKDEINADKDRMDYLNRLNILLRQIIDNLKNDLED